MAHLLLKDVREFAVMNEKVHAHSTMLRQEIALLNNAIFSATLRHLTISPSETERRGKKRQGATPASQKHDRVKQRNIANEVEIPLVGLSAGVFLGWFLLALVVISAAAGHVLFRAQYK